eukprot:3575154-Pyramimonas_sp.AAC.1
MGPRNTVLDLGDACELCHWSQRWSSLGGHGALSRAGLTYSNGTTGPLVELAMGPRSAVMGGGDACERGAPHGATKH